MAMLKILCVVAMIIPTGAFAQQALQPPQMVSPEAVLKNNLGELLFNNAVLTAQIAQERDISAKLREQIAQLTALNKQCSPKEPAK